MVRTLRREGKKRKAQGDHSEETGRIRQKEKDPGQGCSVPAGSLERTYGQKRPGQSKKGKEGKKERKEVRKLILNFIAYVLNV